TCALPIFGDGRDVTEGLEADRPLVDLIPVASLALALLLGVALLDRPGPALDVDRSDRSVVVGRVVVPDGGAQRGQHAHASLGAGLVLVLAQHERVAVAEGAPVDRALALVHAGARSEEHTSELQSREN